MDRYRSAGFLVSAVAFLSLAPGCVAASVPERGLLKKCRDEKTTSITSNIWGGRIEYTDYDANSSCVWSIHVAKDYGIRLIFDLYDIEPCKECKCDFLQFSNSRHGLRYSSKKTCGSYSGDFLPSTRETSKNKYFVGFQSDGSFNHKGFKATYRAFPNSDASHCLSKLQGGSGTIQTPKHPHKYQDDVECEWIIKSDGEDSKVNLTFSAFELEQSDDCLNDYVEIRDGVSKYSPLIGRYCGSEGPASSVLSSNEHLWIRFRSNKNASSVYKGFKAHYGRVFTGAVSQLLVASLPLCILTLLAFISTV